MNGTSIEDSKLKQVVQAIAPESLLQRIWSLQGGISAEMTAFEIKRPHGQIRKMILRRPGKETLQRNPHAAEDEFRVLQLTSSLGLATQRPYYLDQSGQIFPTPYLVIEYIDGKPEFPATPNADFTFQLAEHLAKIHSGDCSDQDTSFLRQHTNTCDEISNKQLISSPFDVAYIRDKLASVPPLTQQNASVLLHGDYWPGNILWRDNRLVAVIDWEDARLGDPLIDLSISRLDILWIFGEDAFHSFIHHYQSLMDIDYTHLPYWDLCAALRLARLIGTDLAGWTAFFIPFGRSDITGDILREHFQFFVTQALEKLAIQ